MIYSARTRGNGQKLKYRTLFKDKEKKKTTNNQTQTKKPNSDLLYWEGDQTLEQVAQRGSQRKYFPN